MHVHAETLAGEETKILFLRIRNFVVNSVPMIDLGNGIPVSCHMICRALAEHFPVRVVDGDFRPGFEHSWLVVKDGSIIDPYPPLMIGGPILLPRKRRFDPWNDFYIPKELNLMERESFAESSAVISEIVAYAMRMTNHRVVLRRLSSV